VAPGLYPFRYPLDKWLFSSYRKRGIPPWPGACFNLWNEAGGSVWQLRTWHQGTLVFPLQPLMPLLWRWKRVLEDKLHVEQHLVTQLPQGRWVNNLQAPTHDVSSPKLPNWPSCLTQVQKACSHVSMTFLGLFVT
jgi:hypothetical protein